MKNIRIEEIKRLNDKCDLILKDTLKKFKFKNVISSVEIKNNAPIEEAELIIVLVKQNKNKK